jgi:PiT family inorganic phosphate transporter
VSFAHGSNDGQKGMGLIMLVLIGVLPTTYALNRVDAEAHLPGFILSSEHISTVFAQRANGVPAPPVEVARAQLADALRLRKVDTPDRYAALAAVAGDIVAGTRQYGALGHVPPGAVQTIRDEAFMVSEAIRLLQKANVAFTPAETQILGEFKKALDNSTKFLPLWVKVATAIALGLGTMVGWKRIVITVGEKIGKTHMNYAQGASAEVVAALTIGAADLYGLPVSTTHVLASGVAGSMAASGSGLQWGTVRSMVLAWVLTLPAAMLLSGGLYFVLRSVF